MAEAGSDARKPAGEKYLASCHTAKRIPMGVSTRSTIVVSRSHAMWRIWVNVLVHES
jgi:hypothetical protein